MLRAQKRTLEGDIQLSIPVGFRGFQRRFEVSVVCGIAEENVDLPKLGEDAADSLFNRSFGADVNAQGEALARQRSGGHGFFHPRFVDVKQGDLRPFFDEAMHGRASNSTRSSRDNRTLAGEFQSSLTLECSPEEAGTP